MNKITAGYLREKMNTLIVIDAHYNGCVRRKRIDYNPAIALYTVDKSGILTDYTNWQEAMDSYNDYDLSADGGK